MINQYLGNYPFLWEMARGGLIGAAIVALHKKEKLALALSIFGLLLFRSALGRSDYYHLLFPLLIALPLIFFALEKLKIKYLTPIFTFLLVMVFARNIVNANFIESKLFQLQTYGKSVGEQEKILPEDELEVVRYIQNSTSAMQRIFVYPWNPEIYFLSERANATKYYTPYAFFTEKYQKDMILELSLNKPALIIYNPEMKFANLTPDSLPLLNDYLLQNYKPTASFGRFLVLTK